MRASTAEILFHCEEDQIAPPYVEAAGTYREGESSILQQSFPVRTIPVSLKTDGEDIFVVSDLHIAAGRGEAGVYPGTENFFADDSFARFLDYAVKVKKSSRAVLILNGDLFDFLRVTHFPGKVTEPRLTTRLKSALKRRPLEARLLRPRPEIVTDEFDRWRIELSRIGVTMTRGELESSISRREKTYGLGTEDFKAVYKLILIRGGHPAFFKALSKWIGRGHRIVVVKGNHDLEWYWPAVRNYFRLLLAEGIAGRTGRKDLNTVLTKRVLPNITFIDDAVLIDEVFYVEHGHRYDKFTMVLDAPRLKKNPHQLSIPFGSFLNRYLINRIELYYPFLDNVRPGTNVLPMMIKQNFPLALKILLQYIPFVVRILTTRLRYVWFMLHSVVWLILALSAPVLLALIFAPGMVGEVSRELGTPGGDGIAGALLNVTRDFGLLILSYLFARAVAWYQLEEPSSLETYAAVRKTGTPFTIMTMGHTHSPGECLMEGGGRFYNTGTWIPIIETSSAAVMEDRTYTFLHVTRDAANGLQVAEGNLLQRWNDDALRGEPLTVVERT
jgi:UDP-2,3-diacylglucosamine pyrophosphatase LpxH